MPKTALYNMEGAAIGEVELSDAIFAAPVHVAALAKNVQQQGGAIPSVRPGKPTADYLKRINNRLTLFAGLFLAILATIPSLLARGTAQSLPFGASSLLIAVSVILETKRQLDDLLINRNYDKIS